MNDSQRFMDISIMTSDASTIIANPAEVYS